MGLSAYSMIRMADGSDRRAENLDAGDAVLDPLAGRPVPLSRVLGSPGVGMVGLEVESGAVLHLTGDQQVYADGAGVPAEKVRVGDSLRTAEGSAQCSAVERLPGDFHVYDLEGEGLSSIVANGFIVRV